MEIAIGVGLRGDARDEFVAVDLFGDIRAADHSLFAACAFQFGSISADIIKRTGDRSLAFPPTRSYSTGCRALIQLSGNSHVIGSHAVSEAYGRGSLGKHSPVIKASYKVDDTVRPILRLGFSASAMATTPKKV
jgi:hypothetical protein